MTAHGSGATYRYMLQQWRLDVDHDTKREIVVLTLGTLAAVPVVTGIGLAVVAGLLAW